MLSAFLMSHSRAASRQKWMHDFSRYAKRFSVKTTVKRPAVLSWPNTGTNNELVNDSVYCKKKKKKCGHHAGAVRLQDFCSKGAGETGPTVAYSSSQTSYSYRWFLWKFTNVSEGIHSPFGPLCVWVCMRLMSSFQHFTWSTDRTLRYVWFQVSWKDVICSRWFLLCSFVITIWDERHQLPYNGVLTEKMFQNININYAQPQDIHKSTRRKTAYMFGRIFGKAGWYVSCLVRDKPIYCRPVPYYLVSNEEDCHPYQVSDWLSTRRRYSSETIFT